jgi:cytidyltransferase-like protein
MNKIYNSSSLKKIINILKSKGKKIVLCHGAFDLFHPGHLDHLAKAKEKGHKVWINPQVIVKHEKKILLST